jgi:hypothetical protein
MLSSPLWRAAFFVYGLVYDCVYDCAQDCVHEQKGWSIWVKMVLVVGLSTILPHILLKC